jgi:hypothetical protein
MLRRWHRCSCTPATSAIRLNPADCVSTGECVAKLRGYHDRDALRRPLDGLKVEVHVPSPKYLEAETGRGKDGRTHIYAQYVYLRTRRGRSPRSPLT